MDGWKGHFYRRSVIYWESVQRRQERSSGGYMDRDLLIRKNNLEVNKVAAKCLRITILFLISLGMFSVTDYYNYDTPSVIITFAGSILLLLIPSVLVNIMHLEKLWIKYYVIMCILSVVFLLSTFISYNFIINLSIFTHIFFKKNNVCNIEIII